MKSGTQDGEMIKMRGYGWKKKGKKVSINPTRNKEEFGDHFVKICIKIPKDISYEIKDIYKKIR